MQLKHRSNQSRIRSTSGFSLIEVAMSLMIVGIVMIGLVDGYRMSSRRAEWSAYSLAAQALALQQIEQVRAAKWDTMADPVVDETLSVPTVSSAVLDMPISGTNAVMATNYVTISSISVGGGITFKQVRVDTVWPWFGRYFTNTLATFRAPDR
jgi:prepilin-type N-terminal cleavage/methylation domain-containing protein